LLHVVVVFECKLALCLDQTCWKLLHLHACLHACLLHVVVFTEDIYAEVD